VSRTATWVKVWVDDGKEHKVIDLIKSQSYCYLETYDRSTKPKPYYEGQYKALRGTADENGDDTDAS
jgi:hypothetical protein